MAYLMANILSACSIISCAAIMERSLVLQFQLAPLLMLGHILPLFRQLLSLCLVRQRCIVFSFECLELDLPFDLSGGVAVARVLDVDVEAR
jgi:hypothetical protein